MLHFDHKRVPRRSSPSGKPDDNCQSNSSRDANAALLQAPITKLPTYSTAAIKLEELGDSTKWWASSCSWGVHDRSMMAVDGGSLLSKFLNGWGRSALELAASTWTMRPISLILPPSMLGNASCSHQRCTNSVTHVEPTTDGTRLQDFYRRDTKRKYHANKVNLHASEDAFSHKVDMPSKLIELKIARMPCIAVFANMQTKNASPWC